MITTTDHNQIKIVKDCFSYIGFKLRQVTGENFAVVLCDDPANLYGFNLVCNHNWQVLVPTEQRMLAHNPSFETIRDLMPKLIQRVENLEN